MTFGSTRSPPAQAVEGVSGGLALIVILSKNESGENDASFPRTARLSFRLCGFGDPGLQRHSLRTIRAIANAALDEMSRSFTALYAEFGRSSIAPEKLLAVLLQPCRSIC
ncbi:hypothetical protein ABIC01_009207 [Bradyrhizobium sp. RT4b]